MNKDIKQTIQGKAKSICPSCFHYLVCRAVDSQPCSNCNQYIPANNVTQTQHGRWVLRGRKILCSKCKAVFEELKEEELFEVKADLPYLCEIEKFCFNCGAKMVKEEA